MKITGTGASAALLSAMLLAKGAPLMGQGDEDDGLAAVAVVASGLGILAIGAYDILTARSSALIYNERALALAPWIEPAQGRYGLSLTLAVGGPSGPEPGRAQPWDPRSGFSAQATKSPQKATLWSLGATLIPIGIGVAAASAGGWNDNQSSLAIGLVGIGSGVIFGPSAGHWYAERHGRAWATTGVRMGLLVLGFLAATTLEFD